VRQKHQAALALFLTGGDVYSGEGAFAEKYVPGVAGDTDDLILVAALFEALADSGLARPIQLRESLIDYGDFRRGKRIGFMALIFRAKRCVTGCGARRGCWNRCGQG